MPAVIFLSSDLMFSSRLLGAAQTLSIPIQLVPSAATLAGTLTLDCRLVIVDLSLASLDLPAVIATVRERAPEARVIAFGAHVDEATLDAARLAGCDAVFTRGQFHKQYAELLRSATT